MAIIPFAPRSAKQSTMREQLSVNRSAIMIHGLPFIQQRHHKLVEPEEIEHLLKQKMREHPENVLVGIVADDLFHRGKPGGMAEVGNVIRRHARKVRQRELHCLAKRGSRAMIDNPELVAVSVVAQRLWEVVTGWCRKDPLEIIAIALGGNWRPVAVEVVRDPLWLAEFNCPLHQVFGADHAIRCGCGCT